MPVPEPADKQTIFSVGHSTQTLEEFIQLLQAHQVKILADVRTIPRSRHNPQFNQETLPGDLQKGGIKYVHLKGLGGLRHPQPNSPNTGWRNPSFQGFADYMQTPEFESGIQALLELAKQGPVAIMCAEALPWRCHRSLIADALLARGVQVEHIMNPKNRTKHVMTRWAQVDGQRVTYPQRSKLELGTQISRTHSSFRMVHSFYTFILRPNRASH